MAELRPDDIVITGIGMQTSLGNAVTSCAAARAGLSMARQLEDLVILTEDGNEEFVVGHAVQSASGFRGMGKLVTLGWAALQDLLSTTDAAALAGDRMGFCLSVPTAPEPEEDEDEEDEDREPPEWLPRDVCAKIIKRAALAIREEDRFVFAGENGGFAAGLRHALAALRTNAWPRCIVGAVDSLLHPDVIDALDESHRLKTKDRPDGLRPGEASAFLLLERHDAACARGARPLAVLRGCAITEWADDAAPGAGLAEAIAGALSADAHAGSVWLLSDHNGESERARELGDALVRLRPQHPEVAKAHRSFPAGSFGDTALASGALASCYASMTLARQHATSRCPIVICSSEYDHSAIRLEGIGQ